jgi:hypothetical protein
MQPIAARARLITDTMRILIWTALVLALTVICLAVGTAALIGLPIAGIEQLALLAAALALAAWGAVLWRVNVRAAAKSARAAKFADAPARRTDKGVPQS